MVVPPDDYPYLSSAEAFDGRAQLTETNAK
jgi:hypothetical protein